MFRRLQDNYPDDFDSQNYTRYRPSMQPGPILWMRRSLPRLFLGLLIGGLVAVSFVGSLLIIPPREPTVVIVTAQPTATANGDLTGDFPAGVMQQSITLPARIDDTLAAGEQRGFRFFVEPGFTWVISVTPDRTLDPLLSLYNPDGTIASISDDISGSNLGSSITLSAPQRAQYAIVIESAANGATAGGYTLDILPQR
jgi:hypothetical protein